MRAGVGGAGGSRCGAGRIDFAEVLEAGSGENGSSTSNHSGTCPGNAAAGRAAIVDTTATGTSRSGKALISVR